MAKAGHLRRDRELPEPVRARGSTSIPTVPSRPCNLWRNELQLQREPMKKMQSPTVLKRMQCADCLLVYLVFMMNAFVFLSIYFFVKLSIV
jgi:hypothetical protein